MAKVISCAIKRSHNCIVREIAVLKGMDECMFATEIILSDSAWSVFASFGTIE